VTKKMGCPDLGFSPLYSVHPRKFLAKVHKHTDAIAFGFLSNPSFSNLFKQGHDSLLQRALF